jgi:hypothetical protein
VLEIVYRRDSVNSQQQPLPQTITPRRHVLQLTPDNLRDMQQLALAGFNGNLSDAINWTLADWMAGGGDILIDAMQQDQVKAKEGSSILQAAGKGS